MGKSTALSQSPAAGAAGVGVVLTCGSPACRHTFEPDPVVFAAGELGCPVCGGWTFQAVLAEPGAGVMTAMVLRCVAEMLRDRAGAVPAGPWWVDVTEQDGLAVLHANVPEDRPPAGGGSVVASFAVRDVDHAGYEGASAAALWIATANPLLGAPLASVLDAAAAGDLPAVRSHLVTLAKIVAAGPYVQGGEGR